MTLVYSGHIPGSAAALVETDRHRILYTSDINTVETKLVNPAKTEGLKVDTLIIESTYGSTNHPPRGETEKRFLESLVEVVEKGGTVLVPAFSVSRGQEIMSLLAEADFEYPVWVDGMIRQITDIYLQHSEYLAMPGLLAKAKEEFNIVRGWQDRRRAYRMPGVIIASAGMLKGGPSLYYLKRMSDFEENGIFFVSYQGKGTPGRDILERGVYLDREERVRARIEWFDFSSHIDQDNILRTIRGLKGLERVILVHGTPEAQEPLAERIREEFGLEVLTPSNGEEIDL